MEQDNTEILGTEVPATEPPPATVEPGQPEPAPEGAPVVRPQMRQIGPRADGPLTIDDLPTVALSPQEIAYLRSLEAQNRVLTMDFGDAVLVVEAKKSNLMRHRNAQQEAYANILRMRGIAEGHFDTNVGVIRVVRGSSGG